MAKTRSGKQTKNQQTNKSNAAVACHANAKLTPAFTMSGADAKTQPSLSAILAAIENEGGEVTKLIEDTRQSITTRLDSLENSLALKKKGNQQSRRKSRDLSKRCQATTPAWI